VKCWGDNSHGELGNGTTTDSAVPVSAAGITDAIAVGASFWSSCALLATGQVKCWGDNDYGTLGDGTAVSSSTPVTVLGLS
jgi:alpha-tubulin suppressor-like RCC1 family protein